MTGISAEDMGVDNDPPVVVVVGVRDGALSSMLSPIPTLLLVLSLFL